MSSEAVEEFLISYKELEKEFQETNENQQTVYEVFLPFQLKPQPQKSVSIKKRVGELLKKSGPIAKEVKQEIKELNKMKGSILNSGDWFMQSFLGSVNSYFLNGSNERRLEFKKEYESFKYNTTVRNIPIILLVFIFFFKLILKVGFIIPFFIYRRIFDQAYQLYMAHAYLSLAFRENILKVNGSNIHPWWIQHHYYSILICLCMLTWPYTESYMMFRSLFYSYALYSSVVQIGQYHYQKRKLYTQQTLGNADYLDTANSDSTPTILSKGSFFMLVPLLFLGDVSFKF
jgi:hypothetical protein